MPTALITGASAGIGAALAHAFAARGYATILVARRRDRLESLASSLPTASRAVAMDLTEAGAGARLLAETGPVDILVNNAGFGASGRVSEIPLARQLEMVALNMGVLTELSGLYLAPMLARRAGRILNVASVAGFQPAPGLAVYAATKAYVLSLSEAMHAELKGTGVTVTCVCPGATESEFAEVAGLQGSPILRNPMSAETVARQAVAGTLAGRRLVVNGAANKARALGVRFVPRGLVVALGRKLLLG